MSNSKGRRGSYSKRANTKLVCDLRDTAELRGLTLTELMAEAGVAQIPNPYSYVGTSIETCRRLAKVTGKDPTAYVAQKLTESDKIHLDTNSILTSDIPELAEVLVRLHSRFWDEVG